MYICIWVHIYIFARRSFVEQPRYDLNMWRTKSCICLGCTDIWTTFWSGGRLWRRGNFCAKLGFLATSLAMEIPPFHEPSGFWSSLLPVWGKVRLQGGAASHLLARFKSANRKGLGCFQRNILNMVAPWFVESTTLDCGSTPWSPVSGPVIWPISQPFGRPLVVRVA